MTRTYRFGKFEWDLEKAAANLKKHKLDFFFAVEAFLDPNRLIAIDEAHSDKEPRYFCVGKVGSRIATVRFTYRKKIVRLIGAGYWRKGKSLYEKENKKKK